MKKMNIYKYDKVFIKDLSIEKIKEAVGTFEFKQTYAAKKYIYMALLSAGFDIECYEEFMYIWTFTLNKTTIIGYTWEDFKNLLNMLKEALNLGRHFVKNVTHRKDHKNGKWKAGETTEETTAPYVLPVFIHNIKYEYAFMKSQITFPEDTFFKDSNKNDPLMLIGENSFLFIDSYKLYPMSLKEVAQCYTKTQKTHDLDFNIPRNAEDAKNLTDKELQYCLNDTRILSELAKYTWQTYFLPYGRLPLTQNQIIRNIIFYEYETALKEMRTEDANTLQKQLRDMTLTQEQHIFIRSEGFRGGTCLSSGRDVIGDIVYGDETSAYFGAIMHGSYPVSRYRPFLIMPKTIEEVDEKCKRFCCQMKIKFYNIIAKGNKNLKYESRNKVVTYMPDGSLPRTNEKGRVLSEDAMVLRNSIKTTSSGRIWKCACFTTSICDIDWEIYKMAYTWERFEVLKMEHAERGQLPDYIKLAAAHLYERKAKLKKAGKTHCAEYYTAKTLVSNIFGAIVKKLDSDIVNGDERAYKAHMLDAALKPQWGVYITAYARKVLCDMINALGDAWLYSDTDSLYFIKTEETMQLINMYNLNMKMKNYEMCQKYGLDYELFDDLGCFDSDGVKIKRFKTLGPKAYMYLTDKNEIKLVLAGIPEKYFWAAYVKKYGNSSKIKNREKEINQIFDFFEVDTEIEYHRNVARPRTNTTKVINGIECHCDTGCIIEDEIIIGTLGNVQEKVMLESTFDSLADKRL